MTEQTPANILTAHEVLKELDARADRLKDEFVAACQAVEAQRAFIDQLWAEHNQAADKKKKPGGRQSSAPNTAPGADAGAKNTLPVLRIAAGVRLRDNDQWQFRFNIRSESSNRLYVVAQNKAKKHWACSCPGWRTRRSCKHLIEIGLPCNEIPHEVQLEEAK